MGQCMPTSTVDQVSELEEQGLVLELASQPPRASKEIAHALALGAGCFWGTEKFVTSGTSGSSFFRSG